MRSTGNYIGSVELLQAGLDILIRQRNASNDPVKVEEINKDIDILSKIISNAGSTKRR